MLGESAGEAGSSAELTASRDDYAASSSEDSSTPDELALGLSLGVGDSRLFKSPLAGPVILTAKDLPSFVPASSPPPPPPSASSSSSSSSSTLSRGEGGAGTKRGADSVAAPTASRYFALLSTRVLDDLGESSACSTQSFGIWAWLYGFSPYTCRSFPLIVRFTELMLVCFWFWHFTYDL